MSTITYTIPNISCSHCIHTIKNEISDLTGVESVEAELDTKKVTVTFDAPASVEEIEATLEEINYPPLKG
ncbi:MAG: heavy-metal-associated domain-containing protein [Chloroflexi bacterium]|nr:heavy-metal-associated domain-containing protein [Chloroflexota bacterium]